MSQPILDHRYRLQSVLGEGAMGQVFLAEDTLTRQPVALKVVSQHAAAGEKSLVQLKQEFRLMTQLRHPNCCAVYSYGTLEDGAPYFTMEVVPGQGLDELLPISSTHFREIFPQLLLALGDLHQRGFVHRDLKPANVRVKPDGSVKLMDFGLMDFAGRQATTLAGTLPYVSPEMVRRGPIDQRSDLYAAGALAYELLTGRPPFVRATPLEMLRAHTSEPIQPPSQLAPSIEPALEPIVLRLLAKEPSERFQSAYEVLEAMGVEVPAGVGGQLLAPPLAGRKREFQALEAKLQALTEGHPGGTVLLWGPAGVGKSRLLEELRFAAELAPVPFALGKAYESGNFPYRHFVWVLKSLLPAMRVHIAPLLERLAPVLVKVLPELAVPALPDLEPSQEKQRLIGAIVETLCALAAQQGFVAVLENWQWADPLSVELLEQLLRNLDGLPMLLVIASRSAHEGAAGALGTLERLALAPLSADEVQRMVMAMLGGAPVAPGFLEQVARLTEGNPLFVERLLEHMVKQGSLVRARDGWRAPAVITTAEAPQDLHGLVASNLTGLSAEAVRVARAAAVIGRSFDLEALLRVTGMAEDVLFDALAELSRQQVIVPGDPGAYGFKQEIFHDTFYAQVEPEVRLGLHALALVALEARLGERPLADAPLELVSALARHALIAGLTEQAIRYALEAGLRNARLFANAEAEELLNAGLRQIQAGAPERWRRERLAYLTAAGDVRRVLRNLKGARTAYEDALPLAREFDDALAAAGLLTSLAKVLQMLGELPAALETCDQALEASQAAGAHGESARCLLTRARIHYYQGRLNEGIGDAERALALAREADDRLQTATALGFMGYLYVTSGPARAEAGIAALREAVATHRAISDRMGLAISLDYLANAQLSAGAYPEAWETFTEKQALCVAIGMRDDQAVGLVNLAHIALDQGRFAEAARIGAEAGALSTAIDSKVPLAFARLFEGAAEARLGRMEKGIRLAEEAFALVEALNNQYLIGHMLPNLVEFWLYVGHLGKAGVLITRLRSLAEETGAPDLQINAKLWEGVWRSLSGEREAARAHLDAALASARTAKARALVVKALKELGRLGIAEEAWEAGQADAEAALGEARAIGMRGEAAELHCLLGEIALATNSGQARHHFETAALEAVETASPLLAALASFGRAAADPYVPEAASWVGVARDGLAEACEGLDAATKERFCARPERQRVRSGNHIDFSLAKVRPRGSGPLQFGSWM